MRSNGLRQPLEIAMGKSLWTYGDPYEEHQDLQERVALHDDTIPDIRVQVAS